MDTKSLKLCVICCAGFSSASTVESDSVLCREHLLNFCKLLANSPPKHNEEYDALLQKSFPGMDTFFVESGMSVCVDCHHQITIAMEKGREAEKKEEEVRSLQRQILEKMKELQKQLDEFHEEMSKVEKTINTSDVSCLMYHIAKNPTKNEDAANGIVLIRDRILDVMTDLRDFQARQNSILSFDINSFLQGLGHEPADDDDDFIPYIPQPEVIIGTEGLLEAGVAPMFFGHTIFTPEGDYRYEHSSKVNGNDGGSDFSADDDSDDSDEVEYIPRNPKSMQPETVVPVITSQKLPPQSTASAISSPVVPIHTVPGPGAKVASSGPHGPGPSVASSGPPGLFKKEFISRAIRREESRRKEEETNLDPLIRYCVKYDATTEKLTVNGFEIIADDRLHTLKCATCGFSRRETRRVGGSLDLEWKLKVHIISTHVGFKCLAPGCTFQCSNHPTFLGHLKQDHGSCSPTKQLMGRNGSNSCTKRAASNNRPLPNLKAIPSPSTRSSPRNQQSSLNNNIRTCPVSACRKTFTRKEVFIKHLQEHRNQNKIQRKEKPKANNEPEPELVILD